MSNESIETTAAPEATAPVEEAPAVAVAPSPAAAVTPSTVSPSTSHSSPPRTGYQGSHSSGSSGGGYSGGRSSGGYSGGGSSGGYSGGGGGGSHSSSSDGGARRRNPKQFRRGRRKVCQFCVNKVKEIDYKSIHIVRKYITERCKMVPRRSSGNCATHQRLLSTAIKRARHMAIIPYVNE